MDKPNSSSKQFGIRLQQLRKEQDLTQVDLSQRSHLSKSYVSFLESGVRHPSRDVVLRLAEALDGKHDDALRDELLVLAGFSPENPQYLKSSSIKSKPHSKKTFQDFLQHTLLLIRQAQYSAAESEIEKGFSRFNQPAQLQTLLAHLELARGHHKQAIVLQKAAIAQQDISPECHEKGLSRVDFILNLGVMYFLQGDQSLFSMLSSPPKQASKHKQAAQNAYLKALKAFEEGLTQDPEHIYLLDEAGRLHFNLADLSDSPDSVHFADKKTAEKHWRTSLRFLKAVLEHPRREELPLKTLLESSAFLALAYAKIGDMHSAQLLLNTLSLQGSDFWLIYYIQSCCYCLAYAANAEESLLERALKTLRKACSLNPDAREQAQLDRKKDLQALAQYRSQDFNEVIS
jgi:transcriptional regulator with XRE-family HTH domain